MRFPTDPSRLSYLVPLDGRIGPSWVVDQAIELAQLSGGQLLGVSTLSPEAAPPVLDSFAQRSQQARVPYESFRASGSRSQALGHLMPRVDMVMVAWFPRALRTFGFSTLDRVIRHATRPIWLAQETDQVPTGLTVAFHGQRKAFHAVRHAARLAQAWQRPVDLLVVAEGRDIDDHDVLIARQELLAQGIAERESRYEQGDTGQVLAGVTAADQLLVMGGAGGGHLFGLTVSRVVQQVLKSPRGPVLICP
ncbi:universal stress protein [Deinococcus multiflagellatus]|uniref:Universal stress protein n=1 Tax=Deinococcus multiflagellatus TaxID=1656887 RepID=A0ABW1ZRM7_9DEIO|nr:universal stress protein [Deinococcus multiflagellatus]MBZ9715413.1 universal stress protein [Deinococcus multiflagellatus]